jgi:hypothetical protein
VGKRCYQAMWRTCCESCCMQTPPSGLQRASCCGTHGCKVQITHDKGGSDAHLPRTNKAQLHGLITVGVPCSAMTQISVSAQSTMENNMEQGMTCAEVAGTVNFLS